MSDQYECGKCIGSYVDDPTRIECALARCRQAKSCQRYEILIGASKLIPDALKLGGHAV